MRTLLAITKLLLVFCSLCLWPTGETLAAEEPLPVVVTIPVLKDWAEQIGGPHVRVVSLLSGLENEHSYSPRPSDLVALRKAKVLLQVGLGLEIWVSSLVKNSGNRDLKTVTTSDGVELIRDHESPARAASPHDAGHRLGNPHVWLDPENAKIMIRHITEAFSQVDPVHAADYRENEAAYVQRLDQLQAELTARLSHLPERRIIVHHPAWPYFARRFGFEIAGEIMTQAGSEPSAHHIQTLIARIRKQDIRIIVSEPQLNQRVPEVLARETGARVIVLTAIPGGVEGTATYLDMLRYNVLHLAKALDRS